MAKFLSDNVLDAALDYIALGDKIAVCDEQPTTYTELSVTFMLAIHNMTPGDGNDYNIANGDVNGRKLTVVAQAAINISNSGTAQHVAIGLASSEVLAVATLTSSQGLASGNNVSIPAFKFTTPDPT